MEQIARTPKDAGHVIRRNRQEKDMTQAQLGDRIHLRQATVSKLESGEPATQLRVFFDALSALELEIVIRPRSMASIQDLEDMF